MFWSSGTPLLNTSILLLSVEGVKPVDRPDMLGLLFGFQQVHYGNVYVQTLVVNVRKLNGYEAIVITDMGDQMFKEFSYSDTVQYVYISLVIPVALCGEQSSFIHHQPLRSKIMISPFLLIHSKMHIKLEKKRATLNGWLPILQEVECTTEVSTTSTC